MQIQNDQKWSHQNPLMFGPYPSVMYQSVPDLQVENSKENTLERSRPLRKLNIVVYCILSDPHDKYNPWNTDIGHNMTI
jgi:hypothetical protein